MTDHELPHKQVVPKHTNEVRNNLNDIVEAVSEGEQRVVVYRYNEPKAVILSSTDYEWLASLEEHVRTHDPEWFTQQHTAWEERNQTIVDNLRKKKELEENLDSVKAQLRRLNADLPSDRKRTDRPLPRRRSPR